MTTEEAKQLIAKYNAGHCTEAEKALLEGWYEIYNEYNLDISQATIGKRGKQIKKLLPGYNKSKGGIKLWSVITAVASVSLIGVITLFFYQRSEETVIQNNAVQDIAPGSSKAMLTLANGKSFSLSGQKEGVVIGGGKITYTDGTVILNDNKGQKGNNTITTPNGGEYQVVLPDGTKVWLNAASTLLYPTTFRERSARKVELRSGEAYFQVVKDSKRPFVVSTGNQEVTVLGTTFNINAYSGRSGTKTSLVEGSVKVTINAGTTKSISKIIKPGEQSIFQNSNIVVKAVDLSLETAWKNGMIQFENAELKTVMVMLVRWYNIDVQYQYYPSEARFSGSIARSKNISEILKLIESTGDIHFKIEGRRVIAMH